MEKNVILNSGGLKCDNPKCDWRDDSISTETYVEWINKACPKCGENVLTEEDYRNSELLLSVAHFMNSLSKEDIELLNSKTPENYLDHLKNNPLFKDAEGLDQIIGEGRVVISFETHKKIKVAKITKLPE